MNREKQKQKIERVSKDRMEIKKEKMIKKRKRIKEN
jgi:hypothetical protein